MKILNMEPARYQSGGNTLTLAVYDLELTDEIRLYGMRLMETPAGHRICYAPSSGGRRFATFARPLAERITELAVLTYEGLKIASTEFKSAA